ncbi:MAG: OmpA family protein, partial [Bacteroidota bacterium]
MTFWNNVIRVFLVLSTSHFGVIAQPDLFDQINSSSDEQHPIVSPDGQTLYFTRANDQNNAGGIRDKGDIWYSTLQPDNRWSTPKNLTTLNNSHWNGIIGMSDDGKTLYLLGHYSTRNGIVRTQGISKSVKKGSRWTSPEDISIPYFKNTSSNFGAYVNADGSVAVFSLESYGTHGAEDIYVSVKGGNNKWSDPKNLGSVINSKFQELTPYLSKDKKTLYFSSNGWGGKGSSDVMSSQRLGESWTEWSKPTPVNEVNSSGRELGYKIFNGYSLYTSTISSDGYGDIKLFTP